MWNYMGIRWLINFSDSTKMHGATIIFINKLYLSKLSSNSCYGKEEIKFRICYVCNAVL